jgi:hypothetical protein
MYVHLDVFIYEYVHIYTPLLYILSNTYIHTCIDSEVIDASIKLLRLLANLCIEEKIGHILADMNTLQVIMYMYVCMYLCLFFTFTSMLLCIYVCMHMYV